jgi:hypothetical protein
MVRVVSALGLAVYSGDEKVFHNCDPGQKREEGLGLRELLLGQVRGVEMLARKPNQTRRHDACQ